MNTAPAFITKASGETLRKYTDYRAFLIAYAQDAKLANPRWTFGVWSQKLGLKDPSSIIKILRGQREPGPEITGKLIRYFGFNTRETQYFEDLIQLRKFKSNSSLAALLLEKMERDHGNFKSMVLDEETFSVISQWYCNAVREMVKLDDFVEDPHWISKRMNFKVTPKETSRAIKLLLKVGLLERDSQGRLRTKSGHFETQTDFASEAIKRYHASTLDHAKLALSTIHVKKREFTAAALTFRYEDLPKAKKMIREFKERFCKEMDLDRGDGVFHLQIQLFPLTREAKTRGKSSLKKDEENNDLRNE